MRKLVFLPGWLLIAIAMWFASLPGARASAFFPGVSPTNVFWPGGTIPYKFDTNYPTTPQQQAVYLNIMREWELAANIHLVPYTGQSNYLLLQYNPSLGSGFCLLGTPTTVSIATLTRAYAHEMGHALGFDHEHQRTDRNSYVTINFSNIIGSSMTNDPEFAAFTIATNDPIYGSYDFESVMHYFRNSFSSNVNFDVIDPLPAYAQKYYYRIGGICLSVGDFAGAAYLYGAPTTVLTNVVTNTADVGFGSLRAAIYYANIHPGTTIRFNIPTSDSGYSNGVWTIKTTGELPPLVGDGTIIDGSTQPGFAGKPLIVLDGSAVLPDAQPSSGLYVYQANCVIKSLAFDNFTAYGVAFATPSATNNALQNCFVGLDATGTNAAPNNFAGALCFEGARTNIIGPSNVISGNLQYGVLIRDTNSGGNIVQGNYIGLDWTGSRGISNWYAGVGVFDLITNTVVGGTTAAARNVISGNGSFGGIYLTGSNNFGTVIQGNYIGLAADGLSRVTNAQVGIYVQSGAQNVTIGGTNAGAGNLISGNQQDGILYFAPGPNPGTLMGNLIGTDKSGTNAAGNSANGVDVTAGTVNLVVGGTSAAARNVVCANQLSGIVISTATTSNITVIGNYVGVGTNGTTAVGNTGTGVYVTQGPGNITIGGTTPGTPNLISGNGGEGVSVFQGAANSIFIQGNAIGTDKTGTVAIGNATGVNINGATQGVLVGGTSVAARNLISGNRDQGVVISDAGTSGNLVMGNYIGVATNGTTALGNNSYGVYILFAPSNTIGGTTVGASNVISGNGSDGITLYGSGTTGNFVQGNYIGVDRTGTVALPNQGSGVTLNAGPQFNTIGGTAAGAGNLLSGNASDGVTLYGTGTTQNLVAGNLIGTDKNGAIAVGNSNNAVSLSTGPQFNIIGGNSAAARNVLSGNGSEGVYIWGPGTANNTVAGNYVGVTAAGNAMLGNAEEGVAIFGGATSNLIGGTSAGAGNMIGGNGFDGVYLSDANTSGNLVQGNFIGVDASGLIPLTNGFQGIVIQSAASGNVVGLSTTGQGAGNRIAFNKYEGIVLYNTNTVGNTIRGNSIYSNGALGINLSGGTEDGAGTTSNHVGGAVPGPNDLQNYPVITSASVDAPETIVRGTLNSTANRSFTIDVYRNAAADPSGHGEGQVYAGSTTVTTDASGNASFTCVFNNSVVSQYYAATATDLVTGDTSEFSADVQSTNGPSAPTIYGPITYSSSAGFGMNIAVTIGQGYHVQGATNLPTTNWVNVTNFTASATNFAFTDRGATNLTKRFYRVVTP